jgi:heavy metal sensor kinase
LVRSLQQALVRRADQIAVTILDELPQKGESYVASEIQARYAPELNERVIRITDASGRAIYASRNANVLSQAAPRPVSDGASLPDRPSYLEEGSGKTSYRVVVLERRLSDGNVYTVEVGGPETNIASSLHDLVITLLIGFPVLIGLAISGGYLLLGRALSPVDEIVRAAERITLKNLNQRLPVPPTGDEFERISQALNRMISRLEESFQVASRFSGDASHELRTPLTIIRGELEVFVRDRTLSAEAQERAGNILEEVDQLTRIIDGLLLVSRLDAGEARMKPVEIDLGELVHTTAEQMEPLAREKSLSFREDIVNGVRAEGDELRLRQVVVNLIDNAIKYTPAGGIISLHVFSREGRPALEVADTGIGISPEALPMIFNRFFRAEEAKAGLSQGAGLGLSIVQSIVEAHGGHVGAERNKRGGATFRVELPGLLSSGSA